MKGSHKWRHMRWISRVLLMWLLMSAWAGFLFIIIPSLTFHGFFVALVTTLVLGFLNAWVRPILVALSIPPTLLIFGSVALLMNSGVLWAGDHLHLWIEDIHLIGLGIFVVLVSALNITFSDLMAIDDDDSYYTYLVYQTINLVHRVEESDIPGVIFLEVDGLSVPVLRHAMEMGYMPTIKEWLESGTHELAPWECDYSSQTSASQAGILLGSNYDIPAFRWYEKDQQKWMVSNNPADSAIIERRLSRSNGLLSDDGASRGNLFSGDAPHTTFTASTISDFSRNSTKDFYPVLMGPYNFFRIMLLFIWDMVRELLAARHQRRHNIRPRIHRGGIYPFLRAGATVLLQELNIHILIGDMIAGVPCVYASFIGYDEVAHHSGVERPDALDVLKKLDAQFDRLQEITHLTPRPYQFVILSDHGQTQGATFKQRYNMTLEELVSDLLSPEIDVELIHSNESGWGNLSLLSDLLPHIIPGSKQFATWMNSRFTKPRQVIHRAARRPHREILKQFDSSHHHKRTKVVVLASGNMGLIYFADWEERLSLEQINEAFPPLIEGLAQHEGIGFILVHSHERGPLVIGAEGTHFLQEDHVEGVDPLAQFGENAPGHLLRASGFPHVADIVVNSVYDPETDEVAAFEELVGSHGGLGGNQSRPFVLFPSEWKSPRSPIIGATNLHKQLKLWLQESSSVSDQASIVGEGMAAMD